MILYANVSVRSPTLAGSNVQRWYYQRLRQQKQTTIFWVSPCTTTLILFRALVNSRMCRSSHFRGSRIQESWVIGFPCLCQETQNPSFSSTAVGTFLLLVSVRLKYASCHLNRPGLSNHHHRHFDQLEPRQWTSAFPLSWEVQYLLCTQSHQLYIVEFHEILSFIQ